MKSHLALNFIGAFLLTISVSCEKESELPDVIVYGHAGTTIYSERWVYPPNTVESVLYALDVLDADGVEVDVQMTKDSVLVLYHDAYLDNVAGLSGCLSDLNFSELADRQVYNSKYKIARLDEVMKISMDRNKKLFLDLKPYNYCDSADINHITFNNSLNSLLSEYSLNERSQITVNTRNSDLLLALSDSSIIKSFETENVDLGIEHCQNNIAKELCIKYSSMTNSLAELLTGLGINFSLFGVKTVNDIRIAVTYLPLKIITDNIAFTKKITQ